MSVLQIPGSVERRASGSSPLRRVSRTALATTAVVASACLVTVAPAGAEDAGLDTSINSVRSGSRLAPHIEAEPDAEGFDRFIVGFHDGERTDIDEVIADTARVGAFGHTQAVVDTGASEVAETATGAVVVSTERKLTEAEAEDFMETIRSSDKVEYVEPDARMTIFSTPNDRYYDRQWPIHGTNGARIDGAWKNAPDAEDIVVAVVDSGILPHPDLDDQVIDGYDFISSPSVSRDGDGRDADPYDNGDWFNRGECGNPQGADSSWHGTHVAGTIGAATNNGIGIAGTAPGVQLLPVRALGKCGGVTSDIADAIIWASGGEVKGVPANTNPADVINLSLGGAGRCSRTYQRAINTAVDNGATVVVAAGNDAINASRVQPANCDNVITVAASGDQGALAVYSNYGETIDITAPGGDMSNGAGVLSTLNNGKRSPGRPNYAFYEGTSMATPLVSGVAALLRKSEPELTPAEIKERIKDTARPMPRSCPLGCGAGLIDAEAVIGEVEEPVEPVEPEEVEATAPEPAPTPDRDNRRPMTYEEWLRMILWLDRYGLGNFWR
ncbi:S8 family peptidase [Corynebacterium sp. CCM 9204]|uniref:S8 family peptidase n=1 Tax=Corynebacterium sp. CCM 9204 TaxID=3057616 RepID=UPI003523C8F7